MVSSHTVYHSKKRGRPKLANQEERLSPTKAHEKKKNQLLRGGQGSVSCPIDILAAQQIITDKQKEALKVYKVLWALAYGKPAKYHGNVWKSIIDGFGFIEDGNTEDPEKRKKVVQRYHDADSALKVYGREARNGIRLLCEGKMPHYFQPAINYAYMRFVHICELDKMDNFLLGIKNSKTKNKTLLRKSDEVASQKRILLKKIENLSDISEPHYNIFARDQMKLAMNGLMREFKI